MNFRESDLWEVPQPPFENCLDDLWRQRGTALILEFRMPRRVLSSSPLNGGIREDLNGAVNINLQAFKPEVRLEAASYKAELVRLAEGLDLDPQRTTALGTAAWMERYGWARLQDRDITVEVLATGGIERNAVRAGDPAGYRETAPGDFEILEREPAPGTLNLFVTLDADLDPGTLAKALITVTEAKAGVVQDLLIPSTQSPRPATGSGTDGVVLVANPAGPPRTDAGTHSKLGELLGKATQLAIRRSFINNSASATPQTHAVLKLWERFGITELTLYLKAKEQGIQLGQQEFSRRLDRLSHDSPLIVLSMLYLQLVDNFMTGLLEWGEVYREALRIIAQLFGGDPAMREVLTFARQLDYPVTVPQLVDLFERILLQRLIQEA